LRNVLIAGAALVTISGSALAGEGNTTRQAYQAMINSLLGRAVQLNTPVAHSCDETLCYDTRFFQTGETTVILSMFSDSGSQACMIRPDSTGFCQNSKGEDYNVTLDGKGLHQGAFTQTHFDGE
jgi:hypothetical protein